MAEHSTATLGNQAGTLLSINFKGEGMKQDYAWKSMNYSVPAQDAGKELDRIKKKYEGRLKAQDVVNESVPEKAVLHAIFEWNDTVAGNEYRKHQSRTMIRNIRVIKPDKTTEPKYVHIRVVKEDGKKNGYYEDARTAARDENLFTLAMKELRAKVEIAQRSAEELARMATQEQPEGTAAVIDICIQALATANHALDRLSPH